MEQSAGTSRRVALLATALVLLPVTLVPLPPATDLAQHVAQAALFDAWRAGDPMYALRWAGPNNLCYAPILALRSWLSAWDTGRAMVALVLAGWALGFAGLARARGRSPWVALLVCVPAFNAALAWGFLNFLVGVPVFCAWLATLLGAPAGVGADPHAAPGGQRPAEGGPRRDAAGASAARPAAPDGGPAAGAPGVPAPLRLLGLVVLAALLYAAHALWFAAAGVSLLTALATREGRAWGTRAALLRAATMLPTGIVAAAWYPAMVAARARGGFPLEPRMGPMPWERLAPEALVERVLGAVRGSAEPALVAGLALWGAWAVWTSRAAARTQTLDDGPHARVDRPLLAVAGVLLLAGLLLPEKYVNTILFAQRWVPVGVALLLMALPFPAAGAPPTGMPRAALLAGTLLLAQVAQTSLAWRASAAQDLDGLRPALDALAHVTPRAKEGPTVLGLDFAPESAVMRGRPFVQTFAWAQAERGGRLNFSFAEHDSTLVTWANDADRPPFTPGLEWMPGRVGARDLALADAVLVHAEAEAHTAFAARSGLRPLTDTGVWRAYAH